MPCYHHLRFSATIPAAPFTTPTVYGMIEKIAMFQASLTPTTEEELRLAVAHANQNNLKVKVVSRFSHTIPKLACPDDARHGSSMLISTLKYNSSIEIDIANLAVTADAGVGLRELIDEVERSGSWWGKGGAVHDHVIGLNLIVPARKSEGYAKIIRIGGRDPLLNAAKVSLGMLGVISKVKLSLEPAFKRSISYDFTDDAHIEDIFMDHGKKYEFADVTWYPSRHTAVYRYDYRVPLNTSGNGEYDFLGFQPNSILVSKTTRSSEKLLESARNVNGKCALATTFVGFKKLVANGLKNGPNLYRLSSSGSSGKNADVRLMLILNEDRHLLCLGSKNQWPVLLRDNSNISCFKIWRFSPRCEETERL
ncbi:hypothetical protein OIU78_023566 [Salix suchowensis]|nr:hypothetical protein OIU78_023566 [Salix suchowensis]